MVPDTSKASLACGADGLLIEVHTEPDKSLCDKNQTINFADLDKILDFKERINEYEN
jgi:3-deoxy-7-phosphoheptulonate synthase